VHLSQPSVVDRLYVAQISRGAKFLQTVAKPRQAGKTARQPATRAAHLGVQQLRLNLFGPRVAVRQSMLEFRQCRSNFGELLSSDKN
jgi:hypothetical protein